MEKHITLPLTEELAKTLRAGDRVFLTGTVYTSRDAGHKRMCEALARGEQLPFDPRDATIYYVGPTPAKPGQVIGSAVNLRSGPGTAYRVVSTASNGARCYIIGLNNGWYKVIYGSNICYIRSDYLELTEIPYENKASSNSPKFFRRGKSTGVAPSASALNGTTSSASQSSSAVSLTGQAIVEEAQKYLGTPYVYGGASPSGFDCSGLVYYVLKTLGCSPNRTPEAQYSHGTYVSKANLQPGDLVFFSGNGSTITHVGIYAGNGQFIHAPNSRSTVSYASLTSGYWSEHFYGARRVS